VSRFLGFSPGRGVWKAHRWVSRILDRPGGRTLLGALASWFASRETTDTSKVFYDGVWIQRFGDDFIATGKRFTFTHASAHEAQMKRCAEFWFNLYRPEPGDVIIDVGGGIGLDTVVFSRAVGERGRVLSIEAHPETFRLLEKTAQWNHLSNVTLCHSAVVDKARPVFLEDKEDHEVNTVSLEWTPGRRTETIDGMTLDDLCQRHGIHQVNFLKMNIEGAEVLALEGMKQMITRTQAVCIACHDFLRGERTELRTRGLVISFLKTYGFAIVTRDEDRRPYVRDHVHGYRATEPASP
jgi:FkbM family methyltransferase